MIAKLRQKKVTPIAKKDTYDLDSFKEVYESSEVVEAVFFVKLDDKKGNFEIGYTALAVPNPSFKKDKEGIHYRSYILKKGSKLGMNYDEYDTFCNTYNDLIKETEGYQMKKYEMV